MKKIVENKAMGINTFAESFIRNKTLYTKKKLRCCLYSYISCEETVRFANYCNQIAAVLICFCSMSLLSLQKIYVAYRHAKCSYRAGSFCRSARENLHCFGFFLIKIESNFLQQVYVLQLMWFIPLVYYPMIEYNENKTH